MLAQLKAALEETGLAFALFGWSRAPEGDYGVFAPDGENDLSAENSHAERAVEGTVDYFTRDASSTPVAAIEAALDSVEALAWYLNSVQYESDSGYIHYEWVFQDAGGSFVQRRAQFDTASRVPFWVVVPEADPDSEPAPATGGG